MGQHCNGFNSFETYLAVCWIDNIESLHNEIIEICKHSDHEEELEEYISDMVRNSLIEECNLASDLLNSALEEIDFRELHAHYKPIEDEDEDEDEEDEDEKKRREFEEENHFPICTENYKQD